MIKTILHLDMNSYFATAEQQANPYLRGKPVGVIKAEGRGCVIAASVEAKKFGVKTGCTTWEAKELCPWIVFVPADMDKYFSLTQRLVKIAGDYSPTLEIFSIDEFFLDVTDSHNLWPGGAYQIALELKQKVREELGEWMTCSVGISFTKLLAKLASEMQKPNGLTFLSPEDYLDKTRDVKVSEVCGIGRAREAWLAGRGVYTLGQARKLILPREIEDLVWLRLDEPLATIADLSPAKSVSRTYTAFRAQDTRDKVQRLIRNLVEEACMKLREMGMAGRTFALSLSVDQLTSFSVRKTVKTPMDDPLIVYELLAKEYEKRPVIGVRQAGVWITNLIFNYQFLIFNQRQKLLEAADKVNQKFGLFTLYPASLLGGELVRPEVTGYLGDKYYRFSSGQWGRPGI